MSQRCPSQHTHFLQNVPNLHATRLTRAFGLDAEEPVAMARALPNLPTHLPTLGFANVTQTVYPLLYGKLQPDPATREAGMLQMLGSARAFQARGVGSSERLSTVMEGVTYVVPESNDGTCPFNVSSLC